MPKERTITKIISSNLNVSSFQTVYEWEKILSKELSIKIKKENLLKNWIYRQIELKLKLTGILNFVTPKKNLSLMYVMEALTYRKCRYSKNVIPIIIDFWLKIEELNKFYKSYRYCPLILITSAEVFRFLKENNCPLNIEHWPLSLPDTSIIKRASNFKKKYSLSLVGRTNPFFLRLLTKYCKEHPDFEYVYGSDDIDNRYFLSNKGNFICHAKDRESYFNIIRKSKIVFYTTPGLDESKKETNQFNQVTPRFLELLSGSCYIMSRFPNNPDTEFYEMSTISYKIDNYEQFEKTLNCLRESNIIPVKKNNNYLKKHLTTARIPLLLEILKNNKIRIIKN